MTQRIHTPGPLHINGQNILTHETEIGIAKVYGNIGQPREANARLLGAAYNAFDSAANKLGCNAVELAERMADGGIAELVETLRLFEESRTAFEHANDAASEMIYAKAVERNRGILAKVTGGAA